MRRSRKNPPYGLSSRCAPFAKNAFSPGSPPASPEFRVEASSAFFFGIAHLSIGTARAERSRFRITLIRMPQLRRVFCLMVPWEIPTSSKRPSRMAMIGEPLSPGIRPLLTMNMCLGSALATVMPDGAFVALTIPSRTLIPVLNGRRFEFCYFYQ